MYLLYNQNGDIVDKLEFYNKTFDFFYDIIPVDYYSVVFLLDMTRYPIDVQFYVFSNETKYVAWYDLPLYSEKYQDAYDQYLKYFSDNYSSVSDISESNMLTLIFMNDGYVYDEYEKVDFGNDIMRRTNWHVEWISKHLPLEYGINYGVKDLKSIVHIDSSSMSYDAFLCAYPDQISCPVYDSSSPYEKGGNDPINSISVYDCKDYWHLVTEGCYSYANVEFTFLLSKTRDFEQKDFLDVLKFLQPIAQRLLAGEKIDYYHILYNDDFACIDNSNIAGLIAVNDPYVASIDDLDFICFVGITKDELNALIDKKISAQELYNKIGSVTDYDRKSVI